MKSRYIEKANLQISKESKSPKIVSPWVDQKILLAGGFIYKLIAWSSDTKTRQNTFNQKDLIDLAICWSGK